jgi:MerR family transcriptional regulator, copper efflux regulator
MERGYLRSGELAQLAGISVDTLRHYEQIGVLPRPARTEGNYRRYPAHAIERVRLVRHALAIGFSLPELAKVLRVREKGGAPCRQVRALLDEKLARVDQEIADLHALREQLRTLVKDWDQRLEQTPSDQPARLLETLSKEGKPNENSNHRAVSRAGMSAAFTARRR